MNLFDVIVVGAGPAGIACTFSLLDSGLSVLLLEKHQFPRDKVCGDALSADVVKQLRKFFPAAYNDFKELSVIQPSYGVKFFAPNEQSIEIEFRSESGDAPGYICRRRDFDHFLFEKLMSGKNERITIRQGAEIQKIKRNSDGIEVQTDLGVFNGKMIIGCDGSNSVVRRTFFGTGIERKHHCAGVRAYMKNVKGISEKKSIELHFLKDILPGYFWIFPLTDNTANVGVGILSEEISHRKINLREILNEIIDFHPEISKRFASAEMVGDIKGFGLPLGSKKRRLSGERFLLAGDAAGLIDPFTGEGIGNALRSGRYAAEHAIKCFEQNRFSAHFNKKYDRFVFKKMWRELRLSGRIQKLLYYPALFNFVIGKAQKNPALRKLLSGMLDDVTLKKELLKPIFYFRLLFNIHQ